MREAFKNAQPHHVGNGAIATKTQQLSIIGDLMPDPFRGI